MAPTLAPSRRAMLRGSAAVLLAAGTSAAAATATTDAGPDAELLAACAVFAAAAQEVARLERIDDLPDEEFEPANDALHTALIRVSELRARTAAGVQAKAAVCRAVLASDEPSAVTGRFDVPARRHDVLAWSTLADMAEAGA